MTDQIDEIRLQRLVDGALDADQRREFLAGLDRAPELWREVALAFVEEQVFRSELGVASRLQDGADATAVKSRAHATVSPTIVLALAVSLLVMLAVGFCWGQWQAGPLAPSSPPRIATHSDTEREVGDEVKVPPNEPLDPVPAYRLMLTHQGGEAVELPVYERSRIEDLPWDPADMRRFERLNEALVQRGYRADMQTEYLSGRLEDGRQIVVPCRTVSLKYDAQ